MLTVATSVGDISYNVQVRDLAAICDDRLRASCVTGLRKFHHDSLLRVLWREGALCSFWNRCSGSFCEL